MKNTKNSATQILEKSIKSLRENLDSLSMDKFVATTIETLMGMERNDHLEKIDDPSIDRGNGYYARALGTFSRNSLLINIPRTRTGLFSPHTLELLKINREQVDEIALSLYKKGMTSKDIESFLKEVFAENLSPSKLSDLAKVFNKFREAWKNSKLERHYKVVFGDVVFVTVRRGNSYAKEGVFVASGVREDNKRELLILELNPTESASYWGEILQELKEKGASKRLIFLSLTGFNT